MIRVQNSASMAAADQNTISGGIPSLVLMERAALSVFRVIREAELDTSNVCVLCGTGNNAADGVAIARLFLEEGDNADLYLLGDEDRYSPDMKHQIDIISNYEVYTVNRFNPEEYTLIVDAIFGTGLKREVTGNYAKAIEKVNESGTPVVSVDIPSGLSSDTGEILGTAVFADITVTFQYPKQGQLIVDGPAVCGDLYVENIGIFPYSDKDDEGCFILTSDDIEDLPSRDETGNKGTFGKLLVIAGNRDICGAAYLSACAALKTGIGMIKIFTSAENRTALSVKLPEALITTYGENTSDLEKLEADLEWADCVLIGPGLGTDDFSAELLKKFLKLNRKPAVMDADALNIMAANPELWKSVQFDCTITPHIGEMSRLSGLGSYTIKADPIGTARTFAAEHNTTCILKDYVTVTAYKSGLAFINTSGCSALASAGTGDVLAGMTAGMITRYRNTVFPLAAMSVYIHGLAGEQAAEELGIEAVTSNDLLDYIN